MEAELTAAFFEWSDSAAIDFEVMFDEVSGGQLRLLVSGQAVTIDFAECEVKCKSSKQSFVDWLEWAETYMSDNACEIMTKEVLPVKVIEILLNKFGEFQEYETEFSDQDDVDYREDILMEERKEMYAAAQRGEISVHSTEFVGTYCDHFFFKEAGKAEELLARTIAMQPELNYALSISSYPSIGTVRLELDLSFLDISDQAMLMLGLNFQATLSVTASVSDIHLMQTQHLTCWTPQLLAFMQFEVCQGGRADSYGCREYIKGRLNLFKEEVYNKLKEENEIPPVIKLTRENSRDKPKSKPVKVNKSKCKQLVEMGYSSLQAEEALKSTGNDVELAVHLLSSGEVTEMMSSASVITTSNLFYNMLFYLRDRLENCSNYCYICYKRHKGDSSRMRPCNQEICEFRFEEISGFSVYPEVQANINLIHLDLSFAAAALASTRALTIFEPFPSFMLKQSQVRGKAGFLSKDGPKYDTKMDSNKDMEKLIAAFQQIPHPTAIRDFCVDEPSLIELITGAGGASIDTYKTLRYIIATNRLNLVKLEDGDKVPTIGANISQYLVTNHSAEADSFFQSEKAKHGSFFAFHGSAIENWYSIVRNGIRNLSNTHMMTAGAAYGAGVYAAQAMSTSWGYCQSRGTSNQAWAHSMFTGTNLCCMAIIEVVNKGYNKGNGIYVIENDRHIMIRYLLLISMTGSADTSLNADNLGLAEHLEKISARLKHFEKLTKQRRIEEAVVRAREKERLAKLAEQQFQEQQAAKKRAEEEEKLDPSVENKLKAMEQAFSGAGSAASTKRIMNEYKYLLKSKECKGLRVEFVGESLYVWMVTIDVDQFELSRDLKGDFETYSRKHSRPKELVFEVRFDSNFPFNPPFVRVVRPRFAFRTGHITIGGSICTESLTPSGWIPVRTIESIFIEIMVNMSEGGARLDPSSSDLEYTLRDAQEAFNRVARQHNWI